MSVRLYCDDPSGLLREIRAAIRDRSIETWELDKDGDLTHSTEQWKNVAWFQPVVEENRVLFRILGRKAGKMTKVTYGVYHGRLIEMLLTHFDKKFKRATATALPANGDVIG